MESEEMGLNPKFIFQCDIWESCLTSLSLGFLMDIRVNDVSSALSLPCSY